MAHEYLVLRNTRDITILFSGFAILSVSGTAIMIYDTWNAFRASDRTAIVLGIILIPFMLLICLGVFYVLSWKCTVQGDRIVKRTLFWRKSFTFSDIKRVERSSGSATRGKRRWIESLTLYDSKGHHSKAKVLLRVSPCTGYWEFVAYLKDRNIHIRNAPHR